MKNSAAIFSIPSLKKPKALAPGDTIAVLSTSYPTGYPDADYPASETLFEKAIAWLEQQGFDAKLMPNAKKRQAYLAGSDGERLSDLHQAFTDPEVKGILCARGGYGTMRFVHQIDFDVIEQNPKVFMGFSDITTLHLAFYQQAGLAGFYAPMLTTNLIQDEPYSQNALLEMVQGNFKLPFQIPNQAPSYTCLSPGTAEAPLTGGNMSLLAALCGTPYQAKTDGHILFLEDWQEKHYAIDRKYQQMKLSGLFEHIKGLIFCDFSAIEKEPGQSLPELFQELTQELQARKIPVGYGFSVGHGDQTGTLPYGIRCQFNAEKGTLTLVDSPFSN